MARVTVEDCVTRVPNRFDLVLLGARRGRDIAAGAPLTVERDNDKNAVVALREIADGTISTEVLGDQIIRAFQKHVEVDEPEAEMMELSASAEDLSQLAGEAAKTKVAVEDDEALEDDEAIEDDEAPIEDDDEAGEDAGPGEDGDIGENAGSGEDDAPSKEPDTRPDQD
jgi:DNA-directed RNA polymerase subunit omega